jgi:hypothetical protein
MRIPEHDLDEALYYRLGIETGILELDGAKEWAFRVIQDRDAPPFEIIEIATAKSRRILLDALCALERPLGSGRATARLFSLVAERLTNGQLSTLAALKAAMYIANFAPELEPSRLALDIVQDALWLAEDGSYGTLQEVRAELVEVLVSEAKLNEERPC